MTRRQGYRFRLKPTHADLAMLRRFVGCVRFVWNELLALNELRRRSSQRCLRYGAMCRRLSALKTEYPFLREVHSQPLQQTLKDLDHAYRRAFDPKVQAGMPRFKKRGRAMGIRFPQGFKIDGNGIYVPKIGWIGFRKSRALEGKPKNVTVSFDGCRWYIAIQTQRDIPDALCPVSAEVGIDLGVVHFAALSDGSFIEGAGACGRYQPRLALLQRRLSRKRKFSANWGKAKAKISRLHCRIADVRNDLLHKASTTISKNHALVVMEDLQIPNMTASASGTLERPGINVRAKSGLNRSMLDQGWGEFRRQLDYKLKWNGGRLILVDPRDTSQTCSCCGYVAAQNRNSQASFHCVACGHAANADTNAAINILRRAGQARIACGDPSLDRSAKQETRRVAKRRARRILDPRVEEYVNF